MTGWLVAEVIMCPRSSCGLSYSPKSVSKNRIGGKKRAEGGARLRGEIVGILRWLGGRGPQAQREGWVGLSLE